MNATDYHMMYPSMNAAALLGSCEAQADDCEDEEVKNFLCDCKYDKNGDIMQEPGSKTHRT